MIPETKRETVEVTWSTACAVKAGPQADNLVAERVMGWHRRFYPPAADYAWFDADGELVRRLGQWEPSENMGDAWMLVEALKARGFHATVCWYGTGTWMATFDHPGEAFDIESEGDTYLGNNASAETAPLAICQAALKATA